MIFGSIDNYQQIDEDIADILLKAGTGVSTGQILSDVNAIIPEDAEEAYNCFSIKYSRQGVWLNRDLVVILMLHYGYILESTTAGGNVDNLGPNITVLKFQHIDNNRVVYIGNNAQFDVQNRSNASGTHWSCVIPVLKENIILMTQPNDRQDRNLFEQDNPQNLKNLGERKLPLTPEYRGCWEQVKKHAGKSAMTVAGLVLLYKVVKYYRGK